eukprot:6150036-Pleurochrysis_carterae.AAC.7
MMIAAVTAVVSAVVAAAVAKETSHRGGRARNSTPLRSNRGRCHVRCRRALLGRVARGRVTRRRERDSGGLFVAFGVRTQLPVGAQAARRRREERLC